jgi:hypothetical protein
MVGGVGSTPVHWTRIVEPLHHACDHHDRAHHSHHGPHRAHREVSETTGAEFDTTRPALLGIRPYWQFLERENAWDRFAAGPAKAGSEPAATTRLAMNAPKIGDVAPPAPVQPPAKTAEVNAYRRPASTGRLIDVMA